MQSVSMLVSRSELQKFSNNKISDQQDENETHRDFLKHYLSRSKDSPFGSYFYNKGYVITKLKSMKEPNVKLPLWLNGPLKAPRQPMITVCYNSDDEVGNNDPNNNVVAASKCIPHPSLQDFNSASNFKIKIVDFHSTSQFHFQYNLESLKSMSQKMNCFYNNSEIETKYRIKTAYEGMQAAAFVGESWARVEVLSVPKQLVYLVDYGVKINVVFDDLRYLEESFSSPARKFVEGSLFGVKPAGGENFWSAEATVNFMLKTKDIECYATFKSETHNVFSLEIFKDENKTKSLSNYMIAKGFAEPMGFP